MFPWLENAPDMLGKCSRTSCKLRAFLVFSDPGSISQSNSREKYLKCAPIKRSISQAKHLRCKPINRHMTPASQDPNVDIRTAILFVLTVPSHFLEFRTLLCVTNGEKTDQNRALAARARIGSNRLEPSRPEPDPSNRTLNSPKGGGFSSDGDICWPEVVKKKGPRLR